MSVIFPVALRRLLATMNPGGDFGKKELSPALSNRFTQIWVPAIEDQTELGAILEARLAAGVEKAAVAQRLLDFWAFFRSHSPSARGGGLSVRDLLAWVGFINTTAPNIGDWGAYAHGAHLTLLDGVGLGVGVPPAAVAALRRLCEAFLAAQLPPGAERHAEAAAGRITLPPADELAAATPAGAWGIPPFFAARAGPSNAGGDAAGASADANGSATTGSVGAAFEVSAPTTARNAFRVLRALQVKKAVLLEGSPGVGKTSLVAALARSLGRQLIRINLSEQTDMMDLLGADLPAPDGAPGQFTWCAALRVVLLLATRYYCHLWLVCNNSLEQYAWFLFSAGATARCCRPSSRAPGCCLTSSTSRGRAFWRA